MFPVNYCLIDPLIADVRKIVTINQREEMMKKLVAISTVALVSLTAPAFAGGHIQVSGNANDAAANAGTVNAAGKIAGNEKASEAVTKGNKGDAADKD